MFSTALTTRACKLTVLADLGLPWNSREQVASPIFTMNSDTNASLSKQLEEIVSCLDAPEDLEATISTLRKIFDNIIQHPNDDKYRQIKLANKTFSSKVWRYPACEKFMKMSGWVVEDDHVRLRDETCVYTVFQLLESFFRPEESTLAAKSASVFGKQTRSNDNSSFVSITDSCSDLGKQYSGSLSQMVDAYLVVAIQTGSGSDLKRLLNEHKSLVTEKRAEILRLAFLCRQIGILRILVHDYKMDANGLDKNGNKAFLNLFCGCDSSDACQSLIIEFIKEFKLSVNTKGNPLAAIHYAILQKLFTVLKFLVEECNVDINESVPFHLNGTPLHLAYATNELDIAKYLIEQGANCNAIDNDGKKPHEYLLKDEGNINLFGENKYCKVAKYLIKSGKLHHYLFTRPYAYYITLCEEGIPELEALERTFEKFPELNEEATPTQSLDLEAVPTMNQLNHYITEMAPCYYTIGLELGIPYSKLKVITSDPSLVDLKKKCLKMLELWLESDTSATWKKLCDAFEDPEVSMCALAERIKKAA